jgi:hypothetical protein
MLQASQRMIGEQNNTIVNEPLGKLRHFEMHEFETSWAAFKSKTIENKEAMHFQET